MLKAICSIILSLFLVSTNAQKSKNKPKIRVSIWEFYDVRTFPKENIFINPLETLNGKDDDKNGFIDDVYGIGFDYQEQPTLHEYTPTYDTVGKVLLRYFHGTAVASVVLRNNPDVELVGVGFLKYVDRPYEPKWLENIKKRLLGNPETDVALLDKLFRTSVAYFKKYNVKVVNISWSAHTDFFKKFLDDLGIYSNENFEKMKKWMQLFHNSLYKVFKENPDIFFVIAAGNENRDIDECFAVPAIIDLPNTITVGGLDKTGRQKANFSNYGKNVKVFATAIYNQLQISPTHVLPDAEGTSFAAPVVTAYVACQLAKGKNFKQIKNELIAQKYIISK